MSHVINDPQLRLNRCLACINVSIIGEGDFICMLDSDKRLLSEEFTPIAENLPAECKDYNFGIF